MSFLSDIWDFCRPWKAYAHESDDGLSAVQSLCPSIMATGGVLAIAAERQRQVNEEGWSLDHDDTHSSGEMSAAASAYAFSAFNNTTYRAYASDPIGFWPWDESWWKPKSPREDLVRAGALIAAEIDRLDRLENETS
jgi:hypothetical protein